MPTEAPAAIAALRAKTFIIVGGARPGKLVVVVMTFSLARESREEYNTMR